MAVTFEEINRIGNPRFSDGVKRPRGWTWMGDESVGWRREPVESGGAEVMTLRCDTNDAVGGWSRRARCKAEKFYRVELVVSCDCEPAGGPGDGGFVLTVQPLEGGEPAENPAELIAPPLLKEPTRLRAYYETSEDIRSLEIQVGLANASGWARVHEVLLCEIIEPEAQSHPLASPPPQFAYPAPKRAGSVCVCTAEGSPQESRSIVDLLSRRFGKRSVSVVSPAQADLGTVAADAVLLPDTLPRQCSSLKALEKLASGRVVVVSLPGFAKLAGQSLSMRTIEQPDDPIHGKVSYANFVTRGFALDDVFPYAWWGEEKRVFIQRQFRRTVPQRNFCRQHGYEPVLVSMCDKDATSDCPIALWKETEDGAVVVLDIEPAEQVPTSFNEPDLAFYILCNVLGAEQNLLGQYSCPAQTEEDLRDEVADLNQRYVDRGMREGGSCHPDKPRRDQFLQIGAEPKAFGLPMPSRRVVLIRTGLRGDDYDGIYGTMSWFKDLLRHEPHHNPYVLGLLANYRLVWIPLCAEYHADFGWRRPADSRPFAMEAEVEPESLAAVIDITTRPTRDLRVAVSDRALRKRMSECLPELQSRLVYERFFYRAVPEEAPVADRSAMDWRWQKLVPRISSGEAGDFDMDLHSQVAEAGVPMVRIEVPAASGYFTAGSIWRTDLVAHLLEHTVGLLWGWLAMNRKSESLRIQPPTPQRREAAVLTRMEASEPVSVPVKVVEGKPVILPTGAVLQVAATE